MFTGSHVKIQCADLRVGKCLAKNSLFVITDFVILVRLSATDGDSFGVNENFSFEDNTCGYWLCVRDCPLSRTERDMPNWTGIESY